jgi:hypothetical protein
VPCTTLKAIRGSAGSCQEQNMVNAKMCDCAGKLKFELDNQDLTQGTLSATQKLIHRHFSLELPDTLFHSQQSVLKLLEATDAELKGAMSNLVDLSLWQTCEGVTRGKEKEILAELHKTSGSLQTLAGARDKAHAAMQTAQVQYLVPPFHRGTWSVPGCMHACCRFDAIAMVAPRSNFVVPYTALHHIVS